MGDDDKKSPSPPRKGTPKPSTSGDSPSSSSRDLEVSPPRQETSSPKPGPSNGGSASGSDCALDDLNFSEVLQTMRMLSQAPSTTNQPPGTITTQTRCPSCNGIVTSVRPVRSREQIIANLKSRQAQMAARGEEHPSWVKAYMEGDSIKAAKLLHLSYLSGRPNGNNKRTTEEPTSTTLDEKKRKRQDSSDTDDDE